jgi:hypothetical protein
MLSSSSPAAPMMYPPPPPPVHPFPPGAAPKKHGPLYWIAVILAVIALVVIVVVIAAFFYAVGTSTTVTGINYTSSDGACGAGGQVGAGFTVAGGGSYPATLLMSAGLFLPCTVHSVTAVTPGFGVTRANTPLTIPASGSAVLSYTIHVPNNYHGALTIDIE